MNHVEEENLVRNLHCFGMKDILTERFVYFQTGKTAVIRRANVRETRVSRYHGSPEGPPEETSRTSQHYDITTLYKVLTFTAVE